MKNDVFQYLKKHFSQEPEDVNRLMVTAFVTRNNISLKKNRFLKSFIIPQSQQKEYQYVQEFLKILQTETDEFSLETLSELFEYVISPAERVVNGAVYTPREIREYIIHESFHSLQSIPNDFKVADISCGCGGFLISAAEKLKTFTSYSYRRIIEENLFGLDIEEYAITRTKILLSLLCLVNGEDTPNLKFHLYQGNALSFDWSKKIQNFQGFSIVVGNPPYVCSRNIQPETKALLSNWSVCSSGHPDLYMPFFQIGLELLIAGGSLGYITMNTFFKSLNGRALRSYLQEKKLSIHIHDFGTHQVFKKRSTYTCICIFRKESSENISYQLINSVDSLWKTPSNFNIIPYKTLDSLTGWNLQNHTIIAKIEQTGVPFSSLYKTRNGVATLKNKIYIFKPIEEDSDYYYLQNGSRYPIEKEICLDIVNPNLLTKETDLEVLKEKIIFPYTFTNEKAKILSEQHLKQKYPETYKYLSAKKKELQTRDKGTGEYEKWFAFGRNQSLEIMPLKLFFPHITPHIPNYIINTEENVTFYNGIAVIGETLEELSFLKKLMSTRLFWFYIKNTSRPYTSGYYSLSKNYIKNFGVFRFSKEQRQFILSETNHLHINTFVEELYGVNLSNFE